MKKITNLKSVSFLITLLCVVNFSFGQIVGWNMTGNVGNEITVNATTIDPNLNMSTLTRGSGLTENVLVNSFNSRGFTPTQADAILNNDYIEFKVSAKGGFLVSLSTLDANFRRTNTGPNQFIWRYSTDGTNFTDIGTTISYFTVGGASGRPQTQINLATIPALQNIINGTTVTFRLYGWGASGGGGTFAFRRNSNPATPTLALGGTVSVAPCGALLTWDSISSTWSNGVGPTILNEVELNGDYDTATFGSFSACSLIVNSGDLRINNNTYVEVQNDVTVDGNLIVETSGDFIQNNDAGTFVDNSNGVQLIKSKIMTYEFGYTHWSSPVKDEMIEQVFGTTRPERRYLFNAFNFVDLLEEVGNTGTFLNNSGIDDLDDDGNDWVISPTGLLEPGVGFATIPSEFGPAFPRTENFIFRGEFNNGIIQIPLINNSGGSYNDWNFLGNPYPSAININQFFSINSGIVDAVYFWDQATAASNTTGGSQGLNFSTDDYAMFNGSGGVGARGDTGSIPNGSIASGQGFFVEALSASSVTFNNSMRINGTTDNSQFFKGSAAKKPKGSNDYNKLWMNLSSDNGVFNQILVSYIDGASNTYDGSFYDLKRITSSGNASFLYSIIENNDNKFAIQGKNPNALDENEIIKLGFKTYIETVTLYKFSIQQLEGSFLTNNSIYIKDNLLNTLHDLSSSDYSFTSEIGEFNERFEIVFNANALSTENIASENNTLKIIELNNDNIQFTTSNSLNIKSVKIFDLLGRQLYDLKGQNSSETYNLSNLSNTVYIAKVTLSNGIIITKKTIKK